MAAYQSPQIQTGGGAVGRMLAKCLRSARPQAWTRGRIIGNLLGIAEYP
jgi:hypothetical protein